MTFESMSAHGYRAEHGARTLDDLLKSEEKEYGRKIAKAQKVSPHSSSYSSMSTKLTESSRLGITRIWN